jgi:hypothetical protein
LSESPPTRSSEQWQWLRDIGAHAELARYVSSKAVRDVGLVGDRALEEPDAEVAERLYDLLRDKEIGYALEPYLQTEGRQQIRDPWLMLRNRVGTCIDFAVTYAGMLLEAAVRPLLAVTERHAFVVIAPGLMLDDTHPEVSLELDGFHRAKFEPDGVLEGDLGAFSAAIRDKALVPIDSTLAQRGGGDFEDATAAGISSGESPELMLIDVLYLQGMPDFEPLDPPAGHAPLYSHVPADDTPFVTYTSHRETIKELTGATGVVALIGLAGQGKSRIARELARNVPLGGGWFLDASEPQTLINSLAAADLAGRAEPAGSRARPDREGYAQNARGLLAETSSPWVVVLDNADQDPGRIERLLPVPGDEQLVLITTTNPAWGKVSGVTPVHLPSIDATEIPEQMKPLEGLIAGLPLLIQAYDTLIGATGWTAETIVEHDPGKDQPLRGQIALFSAIRASEGFTARQVQAAAYAAYLPPDHQPLDVLESLTSGEGEDGARFLAEHGLLTYALEMPGEDRSVLRLHRTFGSAVRDQLEQTEPNLCDTVVRAVTREPRLRELFDVHGDVDTVTRLAARLTEIDARLGGPDSDLGESLHGIAGLLELYGQTRQSGETYRLAEAHLGDGRHQALVADCRHGRARTVNQHHQKDETMLREAVAWAQSARRILTEQEKPADHCLAMEGLLRQKLASFPGPGESELGLLKDALEVIEDADQRRNRPGSTVEPAELARSRFNLAGIRIRLAQSEPEHAQQHLDGAQEIYEDVWERRRRIYDREIHPHIAACIIGLAYADYFRALLIPAGHHERSQWLRNATVHATRALEQRSTLEGSIDLDEVGKVSGFLAKVALARAAAPVSISSVQERIYGDAMRELTKAGIVLQRVPPLPSAREGIANAVETWVRSPALAAVVGEFGGKIPDDLPLGELLDWLDEFSTCWDYRAGKERNLVTSPQFAPVTRKVTLTAAEALGLVGPAAPSGGYYDHVLILGGLVRGCLARPLHAAKLLREGTIDAGAVTALGGFRRIAGDEVGLVERVAQEEVGDEFEAIDAGVRAAFELGGCTGEQGDDSEILGASWRVRDYATASGLAVRVVAAPSTEPGVRRADTPDTYAWFATELAKLQPAQRILLVTTEIYVPFQHANALRMLALPYGVEVDAAGMQPGRLDARLQQQFEPHNYLQELRSTIRALRDLFAAL